MKTGDDLTDFVNDKLFPYLRKFKETADHADTIGHKIGEIFGELKNKIYSSPLVMNRNNSWNLSSQST